MRTDKKPQIVERTTELLRKSNFVVATDYRGLTVSQISEIRRQLRAIGAEYHVVKNTLAKFAAENAAKPELGQLLTGPTALACGKEKMPELVTSILRKVRPNLKIIALTPVSSPNDAKVIEQGIFYYLAKPVGDELVEAVQAAAKVICG